MIADALEEWQAPAPDGELATRPRSVVEKVHLREDLYRGPYADRMPALVVELARDAGYSLSLSPGRFRAMRDAVEPLPEDLLQGSKGRSMPGSHRPEGVIIMDGALAGPLTQECVAPLVLEMAGLRVPGYFDADPDRLTSHKLEWLDRRALHDAYQEARERQRVRRDRDRGQGDEAVRKRLEDLGYF
jgi:hypothetical protein